MCHQEPNVTLKGSKYSAKWGRNRRTVVRLFPWVPFPGYQKAGGWGSQQRQPGASSHHPPLRDFILESSFQSLCAHSYTCIGYKYLLRAPLSPVTTPSSSGCLIHILGNQPESPESEWRWCWVQIYPLGPLTQALPPSTDSLASSPRQSLKTKPEHLKVFKPGIHSTQPTRPMPLCSSPWAPCVALYQWVGGGGQLSNSSDKIFTSEYQFGSRTPTV